jgi:hypothetical protein
VTVRRKPSSAPPAPPGSSATTPATRSARASSPTPSKGRHAGTGTTSRPLDQRQEHRPLLPQDAGLGCKQPVVPPGGRWVVVASIGGRRPVVATQFAFPVVVPSPGIFAGGSSRGRCHRPGAGRFARRGKGGVPSFRQSKIEDFVLEPDDTPFELAFAVRVGAFRRASPGNRPAGPGAAARRAHTNRPPAH